MALVHRAYTCSFLWSRLYIYTGHKHSPSFLFFILCPRIPLSPSARSRDSAESAGANHLPEFMSGDVPNRPEGAGGHLVWHDLCWIPGGRQGLLPGTVGSAVCAVFTLTKQQVALKYFGLPPFSFFFCSQLISDLSNLLFKHYWINLLDPTPPSLSLSLFSGWFRRTSCLSDGKRVLGSGWGGEFWNWLC